MNEVLSVLKGARELLSDPERWTRGAFARDRKGGPVTPFNPRACQWCVTGAINATSSIGCACANRGAALALWKTLVERGDHTRLVAQFNDDPCTAHADVLALLDATIERLEGEQ